MQNSAAPSNLDPSGSIDHTGTLALPPHVTCAYDAFGHLAWRPGLF